MSHTKIKICGITSLADARYCAGAGVDYLGFIQYPESPRYIPASEAKAIIEWLYGPETVGVFVNESAETVNRVVAETDFDVAQIHGQMLPDEIARISCKTIMALAVTEETTEAALRGQLATYEDAVDYFLLDTAKAGLYGGTGATFNWDIARNLTAEYPLFIAGGLGPDNIAEVITTLSPFAIDLSSSVESSPGEKDFDKLGELFDVYDAFRAPESE
ncbi:MAG: phosphoribosylanthranilate isomerase [Bacteroidota bacterium]